jgi:AraC-like DNA-binding protein
MDPQELANLAHLRRARDLIDREYARPLDVPTMAKHALMSPAHFSRRFRAAYGETPYSYLMTRRIERAMTLLRAGMSVTDACMTVGCTSLGSFSSRFTEIVGETPSAYRGREHDAVTAMPGFVVTVIWQFTSAWNDYLFAIFMSNTRNGPITIALNALAGAQSPDYAASMAGALIASLPTLVVYIVLGRWFIGGLMAGSVKS